MNTASPYLKKKDSVPLGHYVSRPDSHIYDFLPMYAQSFLRTNVYLYLQNLKCLGEILMVLFQGVFIVMQNRSVPF